MPSQQRESILISFFGFAFWFLETMYFGWNMSAGSPLEAFADTVVFGLIFTAILWKPVAHTIENHYIYPPEK